jgi:hypothetical protein
MKTNVGRGGRGSEEQRDAAGAPARRVGGLGSILASVALMGAVVLCAEWLFHLGRPSALVSDLRFAAAVVPVGLGLLGVSVVINWRLLRASVPVFAAMNVAFSIVCVWFVAMPLVTWVNVALDRGDPRRVTAVVRSHGYRTATSRYSRPTRYFAGVDVTSTDEGLGNAFVDRSALPGGPDDRPAEGTVLTMSLHPGRLGIPWVDDLLWSDPSQVPSPPRLRLTKSEMDAALAGTPVGRALLEVMQNLNGTPSLPADGGGQ